MQEGWGVGATTATVRCACMQGREGYAFWSSKRVRQSWNCRCVGVQRKPNENAVPVVLFPWVCSVSKGTDEARVCLCFVCRFVNAVKRPDRRWWCILHNRYYYFLLGVHSRQRQRERKGEGEKVTKEVRKEDRQETEAACCRERGGGGKSQCVAGVGGGVLGMYVTG